MQEYQVTLNVTVFDRKALAAAATKEALKMMSLEDWKELRESNYSEVAADLHMLLDPGTSPDGTQIEHGEVTYIDGDDDDYDEDGNLRAGVDNA